MHIILTFYILIVFIISDEKNYFGFGMHPVHFLYCYLVCITYLYFIWFIICSVCIKCMASYWSVPLIFWNNIRSDQFFVVSLISFKIRWMSAIEHIAYEYCTLSYTQAQIEKILIHRAKFLFDSSFRFYLRFCAPLSFLSFLFLFPTRSPSLLENSSSF